MSRAVAVDLELDNDLRLQTLAANANAAHEGAEAMAHSALEFAHTAGVNLAEAKERVEHGKWLAWLEDNFGGSRRTAQVYIQLAGRWNEIQANTQHAALLSVRQALELLTEPKEPDDELEDDIEPDEPEDDEPEIVPPPSGLIKGFGDPRLTRSWEARELSTDVAVLVGQVKAVCGPLTYEMLWEHVHADAKLRRSEPQLRHLLHIGPTNDDAELADMVSRVEDGSAKDIFDAHKQRQAERAEAAKSKLTDADRAIADRAAQDLVGFEKRVSDEGLADMRRITLELSQTDGWEDLDADEKQRFIQTQAGDEHAATIKSSRPKPKPKYKNKAEFFEATARLRATDEDRAEFQELFGEAL